MKLMRRAIIICSWIIAVLIEGCNDSANNTERTSADSTTSGQVTVNVRIDRFPLPPSPGFEEKPEEGYNLRQRFIQLAMEREEISDSIRLVRSNDTLPFPEKSYLEGALMKKYEVYTEKMAEIKYSQCGRTNDCVDIESFEGTPNVPKELVSRFSPSIGLIRWNGDLEERYRGQDEHPGNVKGRHWATGALIADNYLITAGHCFVSDPQSTWILPSRNNQIISANEIAKNMNVVFNYQKNKHTTLLRGDTVSYQIDSLIEFKLGGIDYAIVRLKSGRDGSPPGRRFGVLPIARNTVARNENLCIIQHPLGREKQVETGPVDGVAFPMINYFDIDAFDGSSGSPVISSAKNSLVGIHVDGGCDPDYLDCNKASAISSIYVHSPLIRRLAR